MRGIVVVVALLLVPVQSGVAAAAACRPARGKLVVNLKPGATVTDWVTMLGPVLCRDVVVSDGLADLDLGVALTGKKATGSQLWSAVRAALAQRGLKLSQRGKQWRVSGLPPAVGGVRKLSATSYEVDRATLDGALADPGALTGDVEVALVEDDSGAIAGYELTSVRAGSLLARLGLRRGDLIEAVNDRKIDGLPAALGAVKALRSASRIVVRITAYGEARTMTYTVK
ncbi:MAG: hypothetical protein IT370_28560 [Deltaproteobacteria bacterium]|nr:hypothetical protein [Deltaproteobacteria bacterium]